MKVALRLYGPKISVQAKDAIGRTWQLSTIQVDFQEPQLFGLEYVANDGISSAASHDSPRTLWFDRTILWRSHRALLQVHSRRGWLQCRQ